MTKISHPIVLLGYREFKPKDEALKYKRFVKTNSSERGKFIARLKQEAHL
jgi:hypothetical protein